MLILRPIVKSDTEAFIDLAFKAGIGLTSLPKNRQILTQRISQSIESFSKEIQQPGNERYLFVLEDLKTNTIGGVCGIIAKENSKIPQYYYRIEQFTPKQVHPSVPVHPIPILRTIHYYDAPSEICSLFLLPEFRHDHYGRLLSLGRFLFIGDNLHRFDPCLYAKMCGYFNEDKVSLFWEGIGRHFFDIDFDSLVHLTDEEEIDIGSILPTYPIYISLLPKQVQECIGKIHQETRPAINMLMQEGFQISDEMHVFDGGPILEIETKEVRSIKESILGKVIEISNRPIESQTYIVSNNRLDFRACFSTLQIQKNGISIPAQTADALNVHLDDTIRFVTLHGEPL